jgi:hypothetical protein
MSMRTPPPWFVAGVRGRINRHEYVSICRYDEAKKQDENIAIVWYDPKTGLGQDDARLIAAAPRMLEALRQCEPFLKHFKSGWSSHTPGTIHSGELYDAVLAAIAKAEGQS